MGDGMNEYPWHYALMIHPFATKDDIEEIRELNRWDLMIIFKNGEKFIYDTLMNTHRLIFYENVNELTEEQEAKEFARKLLKMMQRKFITQEELAERIGTSQTMISRYITGECIPNYRVVVKLAKALNCMTDDFRYDDYSNILKEE